MVMAAAFADGKSRQFRFEAPGPGVLHTPFFGMLGRQANLPQAFLACFDPGWSSTPHFHTQDEFQVVLDGEGTLGRHPLKPYGIHFARAYTPYGPLIPHGTIGMTCFVLRAHGDGGAFHLPQHLDKLKQMKHRDPWQIMRTASFAERSGERAADVRLEPVPELNDDRGLAAYTLSVPPGARAIAPDPAHTDGQYIAIVQGTVLHAGRELHAPALIFVYPGESAFELLPGEGGLRALILNFPRITVSSG